MKRNSLTTALLAGLAGAAGLATTAHAVNLNPDGLGQVLIYPYYTVNKGNQTLISVVNTTNRVKAVKVRFLEGLNSREVLDFNLYLSPFDVWTGAVFATGATGPATLKTLDNTCTVPKLPAAGVTFRTFAFSGQHDDNGGTSAERTREGYLEMIEMGVLNATSTQAGAATHAATGIPANCPGLVNNWAVGGTWAVNSAANIELPGGGLYGAETIVDVANGTMHANNADAIEGFYQNAAAPAFLHSNPGTTFPSLKDANSGTGVASSFVFRSNGTLVQSDWNIGTADAVSAVYLHDAIYNEFNTELSLGAASEWVVTFPTKRFYVDLEAQPAAPVRPFTTVFQDNGAACEAVQIGYYDREEQAPGPASLDFSPPPPGAPGNSLCFEAQVVAFNQAAEVTAGATKIFGSTYAANINTALGTGTAQSGWARLTFETSPTTPTLGHVLGLSNDGDAYAGLPVTGFWSANYVNAAAAPGLLANYSGSYRHRASRIISGT